MGRKACKATAGLLRMGPVAEPYGSESGSVDQSSVLHVSGFSSVIRARREFTGYQAQPGPWKRGSRGEVPAPGVVPSAFAAGIAHGVVEGEDGAQRLGRWKGEQVLAKLPSGSHIVRWRWKVQRRGDMEIERSLTGKGFFRETAKWLAASVLLAALYQLLAGGFGPGAYGRLLHAVMVLASDIGFLLPFTVFAGGVAVSRRSSGRGLLVRAASLAVLSYLLMAYAVPLLEYRIVRARGLEVTRLFPFGPETPAAFLDLRSWVEANPPTRYSLSTDEPLSAQPNWTTFLLHSPVVIASFALFAALLGWISAALTSGLSPPARANARWALGLGSGLAFFLPMAAAGEWVRSDPANSALLGAWGPLLVPMAEIVLFLVIARSLGIPLHTRSTSSVS